MVCSLEWCMFGQNRDWFYLSCRAKSHGQQFLEKEWNLSQYSKRHKKLASQAFLSVVLSCQNFSLKQVILVNKLLRYIALLSFVLISSSMICFMHEIGYVGLIGSRILHNTQKITFFLDWLEACKTNTWILS